MAGRSVYTASKRGEFVDRLPRPAQPLAELLYEELDALEALKGQAKKAATTVIGRREDEPIYRHYCRLLDGGTKPKLAKLTLARQIASIVLAVWRAGEAYDPTRLERASNSG